MLENLNMIVGETMKNIRPIKDRLYKEIFIQLLIRNKTVVNVEVVEVFGYKNTKEVIQIMMEDSKKYNKVVNIVDLCLLSYINIYICIIIYII